MADVTVYEDHPDRERMFAQPALLLKAGRPVMRDGEVLEPDLFGATHVVRPGYDAAIRGRVGRFFEDYRDMRLGTFELADGEIEDGGRGRVVVHECGVATRRLAPLRPDQWPEPPSTPRSRAMAASRRSRVHKAASGVSRVLASKWAST